MVGVSYSSPKHPFSGERLTPIFRLSRPSPCARAHFFSAHISAYEGRASGMELLEREVIRARRDAKRQKAAQKEAERTQRAEALQIGYSNHVNSRS